MVVSAMDEIVDERLGSPAVFGAPEPLPRRQRICEGMELRM